jgi:hypothetical protein
VRIRLQAFAIGALAVLLVASSSSAHHVWAVDRTRSITVQGTVTGFEWGNPHVQIFLETKDASGKIEKWTAGAPSPTRMAGTGRRPGTDRLRRLTVTGRLKPDTILSPLGRTKVLRYAYQPRQPRFGR